MSTDKTRGQDSTAIIIIGDNTEVIDSTPNWEGPFAEHDCYSESTGYNYIRCPVCGAEILNGETSTVFHRPAYRYE